MAPIVQNLRHGAAAGSSLFLKPKPAKVPQTVTPEGIRVTPAIAGLNIRRLLPIEDARGEVVEIYSQKKNGGEPPVVYAYTVCLRPGSARGWVVHRKQDDRIAVIGGVMTWALFDDRRASPTRGLLNLYTFSERNRVLFTIPTGVYHAVKNFGPAEAIFLNLPTRPYNHRNPDKYRLPLKNDLIPFDFSQITEGTCW